MYLNQPFLPRSVLLQLIALLQLAKHITQRPCVLILAFLYLHSLALAGILSIELFDTESEKLHDAIFLQDVMFQNQTLIEQQYLGNLIFGNGFQPNLHGEDVLEVTQDLLDVCALLFLD